MFSRFSTLLFLTLFIVSALEALSQQFDPDMAWPLCGRITENPPAGWQVGDDCPADRFGNPDHTDLPIRSVFGPRPLVSENERYDFHRGIDIATPIGTPVFAVADGEVRTAGDHPSYSDPVIIIRHFRNGETSCSNSGCYHSNYLHMDSAVVSQGQDVSKGQFIGYSGESASGFDHLHMEIRDAKPEDPFSSWQRDCVNPVGILPYLSSDSATITFNSVDTTDPNNPLVQITVESPRVDVNRIELFVYDGSDNLVVQPGNTPDALGYNVFPSWFDVNMWNRQYTHKDSSNFPWESFGQGGANECPYHADHPSSYDAHIHMDAADPANYQVGLFNGLRIQTQKFHISGYNINITFNELTGPANCIVAKSFFGTGGEAVNSWGDCSGVLDPPPPHECGNSTCESSESCSTCTSDCGTCSSCGDGTCDFDESCETCQADCGTCSTCGNGACDLTEDCNTCPQDCISGSGPSCGNGICEAAEGEDCKSCPIDCNSKTKGNPKTHFCCGEGGVCGNSQCSSDPYSCTEDPSASYCCGDAICEGAEDTSSCEIDCTAAVCGDGTCDGSEDICFCSADCGSPAGSELSCTDGSDDDCDGAVDCSDSDCGSDPACSSSCTPTHSNEKGKRCSDGIDNDCDGLIDGADTDC
ncbi:MAG: M23 family metallopeptidase [Candidatus Dadabacteria bacterium]|nr:M23 family metallopeptidase [Candidatus Dadabacteria bacterium]NIS08968.1 M23 family metallopeptidase [Candidatus Dadabacteria bacterium]NIV40783.1 peptidoglycan DD-metalloendopeptidase family protein [Candidatus Dadabacteria bacterium]NIY22275.1 peptidoglycan DD-metalloendopeptidase family protein [Candidatus Dadabacteria bacterium]